MKKAFFTFLFLLLCAAAVFIVGWVQIFVPIGKYGVLVSKTSGIHPALIENGTFSWCWERLIPTNTDLRIFQAQNTSFTHSKSGTLPSAEIYSKLAAGSPDFSYDYAITVSVSVTPEHFPALIQEINAKTQTELDSWVQKQSERIAHDVVQYLITNPSAAADAADSYASTAAFIDSADTATRYPFITIHSLEIIPKKQPDLRLYALARKTYEAYELYSTDQLAQEASQASKQAAEEYFLFERYRQLGQLLNEYPILLEYFAVQQQDVQKAFANLELLEKRIQSAAEKPAETQN